MEFSVKSGNPEKQRTDCLILAVFEKKRLSMAASQVDECSDGLISSLYRRGDINGKHGQTVVLHQVPGVSAERVLLVGCGKEKDFDPAAYGKACLAAAKALAGTGSTEAVSYLPCLNIKGRDVVWKTANAVIKTREALYRFDEMKSPRKRATPNKLKRIVMAVTTRRDLAPGETGVKQGTAISNGADFTRNLGNLPANICTPVYLAEQAHKLVGKRRNMDLHVLDEDEMRELGMGALLSVSRGSRQPAKLIVMEYRGGKRTDNPVVLVGKGVTFDSGGISIKPSAQMDEMKYDMCGAATVMGVMKATIELKLPVNLVCMVPATENLPDGEASKPGDIVTSMSGQTIEVLNTDAEGRLILCDALTYAGRYSPDVVIDVATLTGACVMALGRHASGLLGNNSTLTGDLLSAGETAGDPAWEMPLWDEYQEQLNSNFADMANIGGREGGMITAACFLSRFTRKYNWAHLDIAGTAWRTGKSKGATGRPVGMLMQYLLTRCES